MATTMATTFVAPLVTGSSVASASGLYSNSATDTPGIDPDTYSCSQPGYIDFEGLANGYDLSAGAFGGVQFTTTGGYTWAVGTWSSGLYNGKYPSGAYTSQGNAWAWLGTGEGAGKITFLNGPVD